MTKTTQSLKMEANTDPSWCYVGATAGLFKGATAVGILMLTACASVPPPHQALRDAERAIAYAEQSRVADYASPELKEAREKLTAARIAVEQEKMVEAQRLAEQSKADAELASAKAEASKAKAINEEMQKGIGTLKQEMQRSTGDSK